jgi:hypothetical protein
MVVTPGGEELLVGIGGKLVVAEDLLVEEEQ